MNRNPVIADKELCTVEGDCQLEAVIYRATVTTSQEGPDNTRTYIGSTENSFKQRFYLHKSDMKNPKKRNSTRLSQFIAQCKDDKIETNIKWEILKKTCKYKSGTGKCNLCLYEKLFILKDNTGSLLNNKTELMGKCPHRRKWKLLSTKSN